MNALINRVNDTANFVVIGTPCNNFNLQEPGGNGEIMNGLNHVRPGGGFVPKFQLTQKLDVNGADEHAFFTYAKKACAQMSNLLGVPSAMKWSPVKQTDVQWNFEKFLIDRKGRVFKRYAPQVAPLFINGDVQKLLKESA